MEMEIESVEVIPMRGESIWEDTKNDFEVFGITTSLEEWKTQILSDHEREMKSINDDFPSMVSSSFGEDCMDFASRQSAYMLKPVGKFDDTLYMAKTIFVKSLDDVKLEGPLYKIKTKDDGYQIRFGSKEK